VDEQQQFLVLDGEVGDELLLLQQIVLLVQQLRAEGCQLLLQFAVLAVGGLQLLQLPHQGLLVGGGLVLLLLVLAEVVLEVAELGCLLVDQLLQLLELGFDLQGFGLLGFDFLADCAEVVVHFLVVRLLQTQFLHFGCQLLLEFLVGSLQLLYLIF
jgi:hypothetical protein